MDKSDEVAPQHVISVHMQLFFFSSLLRVELRLKNTMLVSRNAECLELRDEKQELNHRLRSEGYDTFICTW